MKSTKPFNEALSDLLRERGSEPGPGRIPGAPMSTRDLSKATESAGHRISHVTISALLRQELEPSRRAMEAIAKGLKIDPMTFAEYRLEVRRDELNWRHVGLKRALKALGE